MAPGDLVLTPNWTWHDHANDSQEPMVWIDGLDGSIVGAIAQPFQEEYPEQTQKIGEELDTSFRMFGGGSFRPAWGEKPLGGHSPQMHYPWSQAKAALDAMAATTNSGSPHDGLIIEYTNPITGGPVMPTIGCYAQLLRPGKRTEAHRHTDSTIYHVIEGQGHSIVGGQRLEWESKDIFVVPSWCFHEHVNTSPNQPAYLFSYTNRPAVEGLYLYREEAASGSV
jgi:gentisate 1,2-dioxygenase